MSCLQTAENAIYIADLDSACPAGPDTRRDGDNEIRSVKRVLQATFPNFLPSSDPSATPVVVSQNIINTIGQRILRAGDAMQGPLYAYADPVTALEVATKRYVDNAYAGLNPGQGSIYPFGILDMFRTPPSPITLNQTDTFAHGMARTPDSIVLQLICSDAAGDQGYAQNDVVFISAAQSNDTVNNQETGGIQAGGNATNVWWTAGAQIWVLNETTGAFANIDPLKWNGVITALILG